MSRQLANAEIYVRRNGELGASCDGTRDTGYVITAEDDGTYTVYPIGGGDEPLVHRATKRAAEMVIAQDWRAPE